MSSNVHTHLCQETLRIIDSLTKDFSTSELRIRLQNVSTVLDGLTGQQAQAYVYYRIKLLLARGWIIKMSSSVKLKPRYKKTEQFEPQSLVQLTKVAERKPALQRENLSTALKSRLNSYRGEMLTLQGEAEECDHLYELYPEHKSAFMEDYQSTVDAKSILLGRIRLLEKQLARLEVR
ncbi:hypothetical protein [Agarivorans sp. B2Z047]|uniref:hypothetical protein n=1 Tax=Agarivorans sp. B2Z047 TaxID=2652721 RepID=UPI00188399E4|nr:hypothetical protein [Agarivorans sp. B2Z047]UQN43518.1 hypothetical protein LQZ07_03285 [Agarivorans sp. B2Z047]